MPVGTSSQVVEVPSAVQPMAMSFEQYEVGNALRSPDSCGSTGATGRHDRFQQTRVLSVCLHKSFDSDSRVPYRNRHCVREESRGTGTSLLYEVL